MKSVPVAVNGYESGNFCPREGITVRDFAEGGIDVDGKVSFCYHPAQLESGTRTETA
jgi:hypothetical protein